MGNIKGIKRDKYKTHGRRRDKAFNVKLTVLELEKINAILEKTEGKSRSDKLLNVLGLGGLND